MPKESILFESAQILSLRHKAVALDLHHKKWKRLVAVFILGTLALWWTTLSVAWKDPWTFLCGTVFYLVFHDIYVVENEGVG